MEFDNLNKFRSGGIGDSMTLSIPKPKTPDGRIYQYSPNKLAFPRHFVIGHYQDDHQVDEQIAKRMKQSPRSDQTVCPYSGIVAHDDEFHHPDDIEAVNKEILHAVENDIADFLSGMAKDFNRRRTRGGLIDISMSVKSSPNPRPIFFRRDLLRELVCPCCSRDYAVYALSLFCPDCGAPSVATHFARERSLAIQQIELAEGLEDQDELAYRLLGNAHEDVLTAFEAVLKAVYFHCLSRDEPESQPKVGTDFQNIDKTRKRFAVWKFDPFEALEDSTLEALRLDIQKRHVIGHNLGIADERFAKHASEAKIGETIPLVGEDIRHFAETCLEVIRSVDDWLMSLPLIEFAGEDLEES